MPSIGGNVVLIVLDTVRARNLSCYGYDRETTPFLDSIAQSGIKYEYAFAPSRFTTPSHASLFTGAYPSVHQTDEENRRLTPDLPTLAELLSEAGYETVGFSNNVRVSETFGYDRGFERWVDNGVGRGEPLGSAIPISNVRSAVEDEGGFYQKALSAIRYCLNEDGSLPATAYNWVNRKLQESDVLSRMDNGAADTASFVEGYLSERDNDRPLFMFLNFMEGHTPFAAPDEYQYAFTDSPESNTWDNLSAFYAGEVPDYDRRLSELVGQYDGAIRYLDVIVKRVVKALEAQGIRDETTVVVTADHGEAFGEHGHYGHAMGLYNELTHVPLIVDPPADATVDVQPPVSEPVSIQWLMPTLLGRRSIERPDSCVDADLFSQGKRPPVLAEASVGAVPGSFPTEEYDVDVRRYLNTKMCVSSKYKILEYPNSNEEEVFALDDETEDNPLGSDAMDAYDDLIEAREEELSAYQQPTRSDRNKRPSVDSQTRDMLAELGYVE